MIKATPNDGLNMLAWLCKQPRARIEQLELQDWQLEMIGRWMMENGRLAMLSPYPEEKTGEFICECGCGEEFMATYTTKPPKYKDPAHRMRAYRKRRKEREPGWTP